MWIWKMAGSRRFIPKLFVWHSSRDIVRMKWRYYRAGFWMTILNDTTKFLDLGPATSNDSTAKIETQIQRQLLQLNKEKLISKTEYKAIRPTGSQRPRMYGLPKTQMYPYVQFCQWPDRPSMNWLSGLPAFSNQSCKTYLPTACLILLPL